MFKDIVQFIKSKTFLTHFIIYMASVFIVIWLVLFFLNAFTRHGETVKVPDFSGLKIKELDNFINGKKVNYLVIDSIYADKAPRGVVVRQEPEMNTEVKENRTIYLYVTSMLPPSIQMPKLVDRSLRQASSMIESYGLKMGRIKFVPDQCANCVLGQTIKGKKIEPGELIEKGTKIDLIVGKGLSDEEVDIPCLYGLTKKEAMAKLMEVSLSVGVITYDDPKDSVSTSARVFKQTPACSKDATINMGGNIDLFFTADKSKIPVVPIIETKEEKNSFDE